MHQGVAADLGPRRDYSVEELVTIAAPESPLIVVLDGIFSLLFFRLGW